VGMDTLDPLKWQVGGSFRSCVDHPMIAVH